MTSLHVLDLDYARVDDAGLASLTGLSRLKILNLTNTRVTDAGVARLQEAQPKLRIRWNTNR